jgi:bacillopeptidase F
MPTSPSKFSGRRWIFVILIIALAQPLTAQTVDTLWSENWEGNWIENWYVDGGTWESGIPESGPGMAYQDSNCAATVLAGNYSEGVRSRLVKIASFTVPSAELNPRLRFWHWFSFSSSDYGYVQIKVGDGDWENISEQFSGVCSNVWTSPSLDLSTYSDSLVQIAFYFHSDNYAGGSADVSSGWYIDNIALLYGSITFNDFERFESGLNDWSADRGTWQVGIPESGPDSAYSESFCSGTRLDGNYSEGVRSRFISPPFIVPAAVNNPRLRFWHWFSFSSSDYGNVQIKVKNGEWQDIFSSYSRTGSGIWTHPSIDLSAYADSLVQIAFYFHSDNYAGGSADVSSGWYIDDFQIVTGPYVFNNPEGFETGIGDWSSERGTWEVGTPTTGPNTSYSGNNCLATRLDGNYHEGVRSNFISPFFKVAPVNENPSLRFWHWYSFSSSDYGEVYIKTISSEWELISNRFSGTSSGVWTNFYADLSSYADSLV